MTRKYHFRTIASRNFKFFRSSSQGNVDVDIVALDRRVERRQPSDIVLTVITYRHSCDDQHRHYRKRHSKESRHAAMRQ